VHVPVQRASEPTEVESSAAAKAAIEALAGSVVSQAPRTAQEPSAFSTTPRSSASCAGPICPKTTGAFAPRAPLWKCIAVTSSAVIAVWGGSPRAGPKSRPLTTNS
jgi:hypothetical protein